MEVSSERQVLADKLRDKPAGLVLRLQAVVDRKALAAEQDTITPTEYRRRGDELTGREQTARRIVGEADHAARDLCNGAPSVVVTEYRRLEQRATDAIHRAFDWRRDADQAATEAERQRIVADADREQDYGVALFEQAVTVLAELNTNA